MNDKDNLRIKMLGVKYSEADLMVYSYTKLFSSALSILSWQIMQQGSLERAFLCSVLMQWSEVDNWERKSGANAWL